jgi:hypothetical protein
VDECAHRENTLKYVRDVYERVHFLKKNVIVIGKTNKVASALREETHVNRVNYRVQNKNYQQKECRNQKDARNREKTAW